MCTACPATGPPPQPAPTGSPRSASGPLPCHPVRKEAFLWVPSPRLEASGRGLDASQVNTSEHSPNTELGPFLLVHKWL